MITSLSRVSNAQEVVIDPSMIASAAANSAEQIDYMIEQISHLTDLGDKITGIRSYIDDIFPEEGEKIMSLLGELGTLEDLSVAYSRSVKATSDGISALKTMKKAGIGDINSILELLSENKRLTEQMIQRSRAILHQAGFSKMEKKQQIESICQEMEKNTQEVEDIIFIQQRISHNVQGLDSFLNCVNDFTNSRNTKTQKEGFSLGGFTRILSTILMLIGIFSLMWGYRIYLQGDGTVFLRIACGILCGVIFLGVLSKLFGV